MTDHALTGRVVAITGASAGIGEACAVRFVGAGARVVLSARRAGRLTDLAARLNAQREGAAIAVPGDVTSEGDMQALVDRALAAYGRLDVMLANAGAGYHGTLDETPPDVVRRLMDVNFIGTYLAARAAMPVFHRQGTGHLVIVSSIVARRGIAGMSAYGATKAAQLGFAEALRTELAGTSIHVSAVFPVSTRTEFHDAMERDFGHSVSGLGPTQDAESVAAAIERTILKPRAEVYPYATSRALAVLNVIAPAVADKLVVKYGRRR
ncbi:MAG: SDR family NAD(P)-dependent oxidoreductase [Acidobacteriota bacterium]|nr:SDR family NAD(P)-dependent oxidoreductase [Acidobacteriota bacterium]